MQSRTSAVDSCLLIPFLLLLTLLLISCGSEPSSPAASASPLVSSGPTRTIEATATSTDAAVVVRSIAGICPSVMNDSDVVRMYGPGLATGYRNGPKDTLYYIDPARSITLRVGTHTDGIVLSATLSEGVSLPTGTTVDDHPEVVTTSLSAPVRIDQNLRLGMSAAAVINLLGQPTFDETAGVVRKITYEVVAENPAEVGWINYNAYYIFKSGRLRSVEIYAGE